MAIGSSLPTASRAAVKFFIASASTSLSFQSFFNLASRPRRSVPLRRRHGRRRKLSFFQSCNRRKTGVCGDDNAALESARQKFFVPNNALRFREPRERGDRNVAASRATGPFADFSGVVFIRSLPPGSTAALPVPGSVYFPASALSCTRSAMAAAPRDPGSIP